MSEYQVDSPVFAAVDVGRLVLFETDDEGATTGRAHNWRAGKVVGFVCADDGDGIVSYTVRELVGPSWAMREVFWDVPAGDAWSTDEAVRP